LPCGVSAGNFSACAIKSSLHLSEPFSVGLGWGGLTHLEDMVSWWIYVHGDVVTGGEHMPTRPRSVGALDSDKVKEKRKNLQKARQCMDLLCVPDKTK